MAMAIAPGLDNVFVYEGCNGPEVLKAMASTPAGAAAPPAQLSASWTIPTDPNSVAIYGQFAMQGQSMAFAVGDNNTTCPTNETSSPQALNFVTMVGGTILQMSNNGVSRLSETAAATGGGLLDQVLMPSYQANVPTRVANPNGWRMVPDIALAATGAFAIYKQGYTFWTGTSISAPLWAGYVALVNQARSMARLGRMGFINPALYAIASNPEAYAVDFYDVTTGSSPAPPKSACPKGVSYSAAKGYDLVTGLGAPLANLIAALAPPAPPQPLPQCYQGYRYCTKFSPPRCAPDFECLIQAPFPK
jgi:subtilase family serine protease